jgi:hypothetical protein
MMDPMAVSISFPEGLFEVPPVRELDEPADGNTAAR